MKMRSWALTLLSLLAILLRRGWSAEQCGWQAGGAVCPGGLCCSQWGFCGTTDPYCGTGCQSQCPTPNPPPPPPPSPPPPSPPPPPPPSPSPPPPPSGSAEQCGWQAGGALCPGGLCCSQWGFCGTTDPYCGTGCQSQCPTPPPPPPSPPPPSPPPPPSSAEQCGWQAGGALCPGGLCCSQWGFCGTTDPYCGAGCQSQCATPNPPPPPSLPPPPPPPPSPPSPPGEDISSLITSSLFDQMLLHRNNAACPGRGFYTYDAFITAAKSFPDFANTGDTETRKRELAAFFGQTSHETTGGWSAAPDGPFAWGYCFKREVNPGSDYCVPNVQWPCVIGKQYFGRGPIQLSYNYNYGQAGEALGLDLLNNPDLVETDPVISFKTALWFWMTPQAPKPSCHAVITGNWVPTVADQLAGRVPGYGVITNIINGGLECGRGPDARVENRIGFYRRYCSDEIFGVSTGDNLDCNTQWSFGNGLLLDSM